LLRFVPINLNMVCISSLKFFYSLSVIMSLTSNRRLTVEVNLFPVFLNNFSNFAGILISFHLYFLTFNILLLEFFWWYNLLEITTTTGNNGEQTTHTTIYHLNLYNQVPLQ
jgi:hypothetical protein